MSISTDPVRRGVPADDLDFAVDRLQISRAGLALTYLAALTVPWTGVRVGGVAFGDAFLILAAVVFVFSDLRRPFVGVPSWVWLFALTILAVGVCNQFIPASQQFMLGRDQLVDNYLLIHTASPLLTNLRVMLPLLVRVVMLAFVFTTARTHDESALGRIATFFVGGVTVSSVIGIVDSRGLLSIGPSLTGFPTEGPRSGGLTQHPNGLALTCVVALPLVVWMLRAFRSKVRAAAGFAFVAMLLGLYASGSRSGAISAAVAAVVVVVWLPQYRRHLATLGLLAAAVVGVLFVLQPNSGNAVLTGLRLVGTDTSGSDRARTIINSQGVRDFLHSPIDGVGFSVAEQAHIVYLQALAVGGVILLGGLLIFMLGALTRSARLARTEPLAIPLFVAVLGAAIFNAGQNALTPTVVYFAGGLIAALPITSTPTAVTGPQTGLQTPSGTRRTIGSWRPGHRG